MSIDEKSIKEQVVKKQKEESLCDKVTLTREQLSKHGLKALNAYKFKRKRGNTLFIEL